MKRKVGALLGAALVALSTSACGLAVNAAVPFDVQPGSIKPVPALQNVDVTVGSKDFTEQIVLGYIAELAIEAAGGNAIDLTNIQGSNSSRYALIDGQIDLQWEYTGTGWLSYLGHDKPIANETEQYKAVRDADLAQNGIAWLPYSELNNTYAFATTEKYAKEHNLESNSDMTEFLKKNPQEAVFCVETEFASRPDGMPGVKKTYGFPTTTTKTFGTGAIYSAIDSGSCNFGEVFTTDGRIAGLNLKVLKDDKQFFPQYNASVTLRNDFYKDHPEIAEVMAPITKALNNDEIIEMNKKVDVDGQDAAEVAKEWMSEKGFIQ